MQISLDVGSPREAGYAVSMFQALRSAMLTDPPPVPEFSQTRIGDVSHTVMTGALAAAQPKDDIAAVVGDLFDLVPAEAIQPQPAPGAAADQDVGQDVGDTAPKRRGRKSNAEKAAEAARAAAAQEHALQPGKALQGVDAMTLAQALEHMPLVHEADGVQVRTAPDTPPDEVAAMKARLQAQDEEIQKEREGQAAAERTAAEAAAAEAAKVVTLPTAAAKPASPIDDDLAALFRGSKKEAPQQSEPPAGSRFAAMDRAQLMTEIVTYINGQGGLFWARSMMTKLGVEVLDDVTDDQFRHVLENPDQYKPAA